MYVLPNKLINESMPITRSTEYFSTLISQQLYPHIVYLVTSVVLVRTFSFSYSHSQFRQ